MIKEQMCATILPVIPSLGVGVMAPPKQMNPAAQ
jgi:hypothetical protein